MARRRGKQSKNHPMDTKPPRTSGGGGRPQLHLSFLNPRKDKSPRSATSDVVPGNPPNPSSSSAETKTSSDSKSQSTATNPTPQSLIDPSSLNRQGQTQLAALQQAESWFNGTANLLSERAELARELAGGITCLLESLRVAGPSTSTADGNDGGEDEKGSETEAEAVAAATEWIRRIAVLRARWNAGTAGRGMERWTGTR